MLLLHQATYGFAKESCYRCGRGGPVIDLDVHIEGEGGLCLCKPCIIDAATTAGVLKPRVQKQRRPAPAKA